MGACTMMDSLLRYCQWIPKTSPSQSRRMGGEYSDDGVDLTLIQWMLSLTPAERLEAMQSSVDFVMEVRARNPQV